MGKSLNTTRLVQSESEDTLPKLLLRNYRRWGNKKIGMEKKELGIWQTYTWKDYYENVKYFSLGLINLGFKPEDKLSILGDNSPEWYWAQLAAEAAHGAIAGIFTDSIPSEVKFIIENSDSKFIVVSDQEQVDKILEIKNDLPLLEKVIYWDPTGLNGYDDPILISLKNVIAFGMEYDRENPEAFEANVKKGKGADIAIILYTSGTSGLPKGVIRTHHNIVTAGHIWCHFSGIDDSWVHLSFYPPAWITEQMVGIAGALWAGHKVSFPESPDTAEDDLREIGPTVFLTAPRIWEGLSSMVQAKISDASLLKRFIYRLFLPVGYKMAGFIKRGEEPTLFWKALNSIAYLLVFRPVKDKLGLLKNKLACTAGALLSPDAFDYFWAIGIRLQQVYGLTEIAPITMQMVDNSVSELDTGPPVPGVEIKISEDGEILIKSEDLLFPGYYNQEDKTKEAIKDGWFHTGDAGYINKEGHLTIIDRLSDLACLPDGTKYSPQFIESRLKFSPYIKDAIILGGEEKPKVTALVGVDLQNVGRWAERNKIAFTTFTDLSQRPKVYDLIQSELERVNKTLPAESRITRFANLYKELDPDEAELTRTRKLRRGFFEETYGDIVDGLYSGTKHVEIDAIVKYRDGKTGGLKTTVEIRPLGVS